LRHDWFRSAGVPLRTAEFVAMGLDPQRPRLLCFAHEERKLAGSVVVRGDETGPVDVKLGPWGEVSGRLVDGAGRPVANATLAFTEIPPRKPRQPASLDVGVQAAFRSSPSANRDPRTDAEGRFRVDSLVPGLRYHLAVYDGVGALKIEDVKWTKLVFRDLVLKPGEVKDLGNVTARPFPKE
jgi:hypothetical protein